MIEISLYVPWLPWKGSSHYLQLGCFWPGWCRFGVGNISGFWPRLLFNPKAAGPSDGHRCALRLVKPHLELQNHNYFWSMPSVLVFLGVLRETRRLRRFTEKHGVLVPYHTIPYCAQAAERHWLLVGATSCDGKRPNVQKMWPEQTEKLRSSHWVNCIFCDLDGRK